MTGIENSHIVPNMRESSTLRTKIGARMGLFSCEDDKKYIFLLAGHKIDFIVTCEENKSYDCYPHVARASSFTLAK